MICGIDEAGRGALAGPLVLAACILKKPIKGLTDSKQLSVKERENLYEKIIDKSLFKIISISSFHIDKFGLSSSYKKVLKEMMLSFKNVEFIFDGNTSFGLSGIKTIIKADEKIKEVSASSILAKVSRDKYMISIDKDFKNYNFAKHKGYPTKGHKEKIKKYGYCLIHRRSFKL